MPIANPKYLVQFGVLGSLFAEIVYKYRQPQGCA